MTPSPAVADLLGRVALFQLTERMADRGERHRHPVVLQRFADFSRAHGARRRRLQDLSDHARVGAALWPAARRTARPCGGCASPTSGGAGSAGSGAASGTSSRTSAASPRWLCGRWCCLSCARSASSSAPPPAGRRGNSASGAGCRARRGFADRFHRRGIAGSEGFAAHRFDLLLQFCHSRSGHCSASSLPRGQNLARFESAKYNNLKPRK